MKDLIIVGAGGLGKEVLQCVKDINRKGQRWNIKGFIDDNPDALANVKCDYQIIGAIKDWQPNNNEVFVCGIATPKVKEKVTQSLKSKGAVFETIISPRAYISDFVTIGEGTVILGYSIGPNVVLGNFTSIMGSMIGQESVIGDFSTTTGYVNVANARLGKRVFVGSHSVILNGRTIGDDVFVCVGSIVMRNVKAGNKVFGNPARRVDI